MTTANSKLEIRALQFPRLLSECFAVLDDNQFQCIADSMDLSVAEVKYIFALAEKDFITMQKVIEGKI